MSEPATDPIPPAVLGIGVDLVEITRMQSTLVRWDPAFKNKVFLPTEQAYCDGRPEPWRHYAGRFAIKEAVSKAFGTGISEHIGWLDIEVQRDPATGAPSVRLNAKGQRLAERRGVGRVLVSLSHTRRYTVAQALLLGRRERETSE
ncbi:MAG: holo-ACP synthase [Verrucomicrobia bacterium]|nr:holo-ACP synthase [Verrucomicrobiota bacterium]